jgi:hypothetical protein
LRDSNRLRLLHVGNAERDVVHDSRRSQIGIKNGKWQLNVYDPDLTRLELMEFKPLRKPCCSDFTGPHPSE